MKIGSNAENLTVIENLRAVLEKSTDEINANHEERETAEASGSGDGELDSTERKSKSIDQVFIYFNLYFIFNLLRNLIIDFYLLP